MIERSKGYGVDTGDVASLLALELVASLAAIERLGCVQIDSISVVDRRTRLATAARFPNARAIVAGEWEEAIDAVVFSPRTAAVLMTHSLDDDARVLSLVSRRR